MRILSVGNQQNQSNSTNFKASLRTGPLELHPGKLVGTARVVNTGKLGPEHWHFQIEDLDPSLITHNGSKLVRGILFDRSLGSKKQGITLLDRTADKLARVVDPNEKGEIDISNELREILGE